MKKKISAYSLFVIISIIIIVVFNILARIRLFCDFYTDHIYRIWANTYGRLMGLFPVSVGELMIIAMIIVVLMAMIFSILLIFIKKEAYKSFCKGYYKVFFTLILITCLLMTFNCSIPYNCSRITFERPAKKSYSEEEIITVYNYVVSECNELYKEVKRDEDGLVCLPDNVQAEVKQALRKLSKQYPRLKGYYPNAKRIMNSFFMNQTGTIGVYFPFSLEANYIKYLSPTFLPSTIAHELAHLKGYMYEDEANFISYLACIGSDNKEVQYAGYISVLYYLEDDIATVKNKKALEKCDNRVWKDAIIYTKNALAEIESKKEFISTEVVEKLDKKFTETYMDYYGVTPNYSEVVRLMLNYYDGILY